MSGHSKWSTIKHKKGAKDAKRSKLFTKMLKEITVATKVSGPDPDSNPRLRLAIKSARKASVPKDNIDKAVNKGSGADAANWEEVTYEGYAPSGVAVFVECLTDNLNRTVANVRSYFSKNGGSLGVNGSVDYMFERKGVFSLNGEGLDEEELLMKLIDFGVEEVEREGEMIIVTCPLIDYGAVSTKLEEMDIDPEDSEVSRIPHNTMALSVEDAQKVLNLINKIEDDDDVQKVFHNLELTDELMAELA